MPGAKAGFSGQDRLHAPRDYAVVFSHRRVLRGEWFHLHYGPSGGSVVRLGLVVPKKHARRAVVRNLVKRIAREAFRQARQGLPKVDLVIRLAKPVARPDDVVRRSWRAEIENLLKRLTA
jgi:ribonuclease P protein component